MPLLAWRQNKQGQEAEGNMRRSSRIKSLFSTDCHESEQDASRLLGNCHKTEQETLKLVSDSVHDSMPKLTGSEFFLPASKKSRKQKSPEEASASCVSKAIFGEKRSRIEKVGPTQRGCTSIGSRQASSNDDFFKPASQRQKKILNAMSEEQLNVTTKEGKGEKAPVCKFDLWTEAKLAAEENAQLCIGKPTHPFFVQHKGGQRASNSLCGNEFTSQPSLPLLEMELAPSPPCHVTQLPEAELYAVNMKRWTCPKIAQNPKVDQASFERESFDQNIIQLDSLLRVFPKKKLSQKPRGDGNSGWQPLDDVLGPILSFLKDYDDDENGIKEVLDEEQFNFSRAYLEERLKVYLSLRTKRFREASLDRNYEWTEDETGGKNLLWTDVYQPESPEQVCGNKNSANMLTLWLEKWQTKTSFMISSGEGGKSSKYASDNEENNENIGCLQEDSDSDESTKEDGSSQNVLFLAGPVGCGKTATIYACARAYGYTVIEVNCSDNRNGLIIKQKFSESMESHRLSKWSADAAGPLNGTVGVPMAATQPNMRENVCRSSNQKGQNIEAKQRNMIDCTAVSEPLENKAFPALKSEQHDSCKERDVPLTILLFEDVDMVFEDDRGFIAAVTQLAATAKRPIILTSNDSKLLLPGRLGADLLEFKKPPTKDLVVLTYLICVAEGVPCRPELLCQMVKLCRHDLRLLLNYLQFWCQGYEKACLSEVNDMQPLTRLDKEADVQSALEAREEVDSIETTNLFELEAQHRLWPLCMPVGFPCSLTQSVACELNNKVAEVERECELEEETRLQHSVMENLALLKKLKKKNIDASVGAEMKGAHNPVNDLTGEEWDNLESPVKNLKDAKALARSPILRDKLKRDLSSTVSEEDSNDNGKAVPETSMRNISGADDLTNTLADDLGVVVSACAVSAVPSSSIGSEIETGAMLDQDPGDRDTDAASNEIDIKIDSPKHELWTNVFNQRNFSCNSDESRMERMPAAINNLWSEFRRTKEKRGLQIRATHRESMDTALLLSELSENLSICDILSRMVLTEDPVLDSISGLTSCCESLESRNMLLTCSTLAHKALLLCIEQFSALPNIQIEEKAKLSFEDMILAVNDPHALGKVVATNGMIPELMNFKRNNIAPLSEEQELKRSERMSSVCSALYDELPSKAHISLQSASFFEILGFLARIGRLEQERLNSGGNRRRGRGFQNYYRIHPWNLSKECINNIEQFGKYGRSSMVDRLVR